jgi:UDP-3-O-[3-hydroxymyristoyl] glucosamine N-acyltransferase
MRPALTVGALAQALGGRVIGDPDRIIGGVSTPAAATPGDLVFVESRHYAEQLQASAAGAALVTADVHVPEGMSAILVDHPSLAMSRAVDLLVPPERFYSSISPLAAIGADVECDEGVGIGPHASIGDGVRIGAGTEIHPNATIGPRCTVGADCRIYAGVHLYHDVTVGDRVVLHSGAVIGADGFGFVPEPAGQPEPDEPTRHRKIRQVGRVVIEDDVEIGANSTIDRASLAETRIARGTKIDNLVMIAHNCTVGRHCIIVAQAGVSGSTSIGDYVTIAGQAGLTGHLAIGRGAIIGPQSGVIDDVEPEQSVLGSPAVDAVRAKRAVFLIGGLPEFRKRLSSHERRLAGLEAAHPPGAAGPGDA